MEILNRIIITFRKNNQNHIVSPNQASQYWHDLKAVVMPPNEEGKFLEIAIPIGTFLSNKDNPVFKSHFVDVVRLRTSPMDVLGYLCYPINQFDNRLDENRLNKALEAKINQPL